MGMVDTRSRRSGTQESPFNFNIPDFQETKNDFWAGSVL